MTKEVVLRSGFASLERGAENVGGLLTLTDRRLIFTAHPFNFNREPAEIALADIELTILTWSETTLWPFKAPLPIFPGVVAVYAKRGKKEHQFLVYFRKRWKRAIDEAVAARQ